MSLSSNAIPRNEGQPAYLQLKEHLLDKIRRGRPNEQLPSINDLIRSHGVSLTTINRAFFSLEKEGLIERRAGKGVFIAELEKELAGEDSPVKSGGILLAYPRYFSRRIFDLSEQVEKEAALAQKSVRVLRLKQETRYEVLFETAAREKPSGMIV
ncbi:MAG: winged helix-turn-helix transcriptional regulator, partial [Spirochaetia bacterium]|nr:winged helix-turn-helix transcriptional regulator [Spirochaetia bacterium]